ncbi:cytochrome B [Sulfitobacter alexandrii]|uniref:Cytochrome B n=1 Tax=Sulfitobacter alexandrii TaxID=1917485 RepID=A0A1J0WME5_9RHOB|nr:cytochrome B [Sulfitobacter alexandrii]
MASTHPTHGRKGAREVSVWDPLVRLIHWGLALAILVNGALADGESRTHALIGYIALSLLAMRMLWALIGPPNARFSAFPPSPLRALRHARAMFGGDRRVHLSHNPIGALMVYNLWLSVLAIGVTGYMMTTLAYFGVDWVEKAHETIFDWLLISVALHVAGVAFDTWHSGINLVKAMVNGRKTIPEGKDIA